MRPTDRHDELPVRAAARMPADEPPRAAPEMHPLRRWVIDHDSSWLFVVAYVGLAVVLSVWISLFWLVAVVGVHFAFECVRQAHHVRGRWRAAASGERGRPARPRPAHHLRGAGRIARRALWEIKLDIALILFALVVAVYLEFVLGVAGLSAAGRLGAQAGARFAGWQRALRGILLTVDDAAQVGRAALLRGGTVADDDKDADTAARWSTGDRISIGFGLLSLALLLLAPALLGETYAGLLDTIAQELHPFPGANGE